MIRRLSGHLGPSVSALVDGQLDPESSERAWDHVLSCAACRAQVEREAWVKRRLATMAGNEPSARLLGSLQRLSARSTESAPTWEGLEAWAAVDELEASTRGRRRLGVALASAGVGGAALVGFAALGPLGLGTGPARPPEASISGSTPTPTSSTVQLPVVARVHGRLAGWRVSDDDHAVAHAVSAAHRR